MPPLGDDQIRQLRDRLDQREAELSEEIRARDPQARAAPTEVPRDEVEDLGEQGEQRMREAVVQAEQERDLRELRQIAAAKERMARGDYGECVDCGVEIPFARLSVQPAATRCVPCQERYERTHDSALRIAPPG
jgi:RNA polymerase-binding transcription factor DksA